VGGVEADTRCPNPRTIKYLYHLLKLVADDYLRRTAITRPILTDEQQDLLDTTISEWQTACNISSRIGWDVSETRKTYLQDLAYDTVLEETRLGSQHAILATSDFAKTSPRSRSNNRVTTRTGQFSALTSASSTSPPPVQHTSHQEGNSGIGTGSSSGFAVISSRLVHNPPIGRFSR
jgi:predicted transposase